MRLYNTLIFSNINKIQCIYQLKNICRGFLRCMAVSYALELYDGFEAAHAVRRTCITMREANIWIKIYYNIINILILTKYINVLINYVH